MDRLHDGGHDDTHGNALQYDAESSPQAQSFGGLRPSLERPQTPKLQKKRSPKQTRAASLPMSRYDGPSYTARLSGGTGGDASSQRNRQGKVSFRNAVRKLFGRRSKEMEPQQTSPPTHAYHRSDHAGLATPSEAAEYPHAYQPGFAQAVLPQRALSAPLQLSLPSPWLGRVRSPNAVEFPQSTRLKPLDLGNPFAAPGQQQLRRRKTLTSLLIGERDAAALAAAVRSGSPPAVPSLYRSRASPSPKIGLAVPSLSSKRRSQSVEDFKSSIVRSRNSSVPRKRSDEIRYWRESSRGSVLRTSTYGFTPSASDDEAAAQEQQSSRVEDNDKTPHPQQGDPFVSSTPPPAPSTIRSSGKAPMYDYRASMSETGLTSASAVGADLAKELEDRVAKLESGLQTFQRSLQHMRAQGKRGTVILGNSPPRRSDQARTPSMLADTLHNPRLPSSYRVQCTPAAEHARELAELEAWRPHEHSQDELQRTLTSPPPAPTSVRDASEALPPVLAASADERPRPPSLVPPSAGPPATLPDSSLATLPTVPQTFPPEAFPPETFPPQAASTQAADPEQPTAGSLTSGAQPGTQTSTTPGPDPTIRSLYLMLAGERSARVRLERTVWNLLSDVSKLQEQLAERSEGTPTAVMGGSQSAEAREDLRQLQQQAARVASSSSPRPLGEEAEVEPTIDSRAQTMSTSILHSEQRRSDPLLGESRQSPVLSWFSGTTSLGSAGLAEAAEDEEEVATPYQSYRTPMEERRFNFGRGDRAEQGGRTGNGHGGMF